MPAILQSTTPSREVIAAILLAFYHLPIQIQGVVVATYRAVGLTKGLSSTGFWLMIFRRDEIRLLLLIRVYPRSLHKFQQQKKTTPATRVVPNNTSTSTMKVVLLLLLSFMKDSNSLLLSSKFRSYPRPSSSRRDFLSKSSAACILGAFSVVLPLATPQKAHAVVPLSETEAKAGIGGGASRKIRPPSRKNCPRQDLALDFAVMLTRSSYIETAQLEIIPVNQLERDMYAVRTNEYQPYLKAVNAAGDVVRQGDLTDPYYFDFMSAVQYMTINRALEDPERDFEQLEPIINSDGTQSPDFKKVSIQRKVPDNRLIPTYDERVGATILTFIQDRYKNTGIGLPQFDDAPRPGKERMLQTFSQLINLFLINGFAWEGKAELVSEKGDGSSTFRLMLQDPATLWSSQVLAKAPLRSDFLRKTAIQLVRTMGYSVTTSSTKLQGNSEITTLTIK